MKTLARLNEQGITHEWDTYTLKSRFEVGSCGRRGGGSKIHLLRTQVVIEDRDPKPGTYKVGNYFSVRSLCSGNGQHTGRVYDRLDTKDVTCQKCLKFLEG